MIYKTAKRVAVAIVGGTVVFIGIVMIVAPGPAFIVIPAGLAILGSEFVWAQRLLKRIKQGAANVAAKVARKTETAQRPPTPDSDR